jgi:hypothetical protein
MKLMNLEIWGSGIEGHLEICESGIRAVCRPTVAGRSRPVEEDGAAGFSPPDTVGVAPLDSQIHRFPDALRFQITRFTIVRRVIRSRIVRP